MICIIDCGLKKSHNFSKILNRFEIKNKTIGMDKIVNTDFYNYSGIIISGAPILLTKVNSKKYLNLFKFIKKYEKPILGICFGHQIIGLLYNSHIYLGQEVRNKEKIEIIKKDMIFSNIKTNELFQEDHCEYITLPLNFILLAKSNSCKNEAMKHKTKNIFGLQFHPEVSGLTGEKILKNFANICK
ncbi:MAG: gamma-glutamyl-gamma-aminobutyrate hydrolase family protein [Gammaproteobacteria bacterium]|nr:gamma-glutamyl-gamma-aminobutyrate hydrolase family protein [Gammaproteobacteria bacterium]